MSKKSENDGKVIKIQQDLENTIQQFLQSSTRGNFMESSKAPSSKVAQWCQIFKRTITQNQLMRREIKSLRRENKKLSSKIGRLTNSLTQQSAYQTLLRQELWSMEEELVQADQEIELLKCNLRSLETIVTHKEEQNRSLMVELNRLSIRANVNLISFDKKIMDIKSKCEKELEKIKLELTVARRNWIKLRSLQVKQQDFQLSEDEETEQSSSQSI